VSDIQPDSGPGDVTSSEKTVANYQAQYEALKTKLHEFPATRFVVWTGAALLASETSPENAARAETFFEWVKTTWNVPGDNIFVFDFRELETDGGIYLLPEHAAGDSHPGAAFAAEVAPYFGQRVVDVIEGRGDTGSLTGH
jgi:hypothetical protein